MRIAVILLLFFFNSLLFAQEFPLKSAIWYYTNNGGDAAPNSYLWTIEYDRDTIINGDTARIIVNRDKAGYGLYDQYIFLSKGDSVYALTKSGVWGLLYVFNVSASDTILLADFENGSNQKVRCVIDSVVPFQYGSQILKRYYNHIIDGQLFNWFYDGYYTDRIGSILFYPSVNGTHILVHSVLRCYVDQDISARFYYHGDCFKGNPMGVDVEEDPEAVVVFPNPANEKIYISIPNNPKTQIQLKDVSGKVILENYSFDGKKYILDVSGLKSGMYLYHILNSKGQAVSGKVMIE